MNSVPTNIYIGVNSLTGEIRPGKIVKGEIRDGTGASQETYRIVCMSESNLSETVGARASLDLGIGPFGFNVGGGIRSEINRSAYSTYVVVRTTCHFNRISQEEPDIDDDDMPEDSINEVNYFVKRNGDAYVSAIQRGAGYYAIYAFEFESMREKKEFDAKVGADGIIKMITLDVEAKAELKEIRESTNATCFFYQKMYGASSLQFPNEDQICEFALQFPAKIKKEEAEVLDWEIAYYEDAKPSIGEGTYQNVISNRKSLLSREQDAAKISHQLSKINQLKDIYSTYKLTRPSRIFEDKQADIILNDVQDDAKKIKRIYNEYLENPAHEALKDKIDNIQFPCLKHGAPILKFKHFVTKIGLERQLNFNIPMFIKGAGDYETKIKRFIEYQYRLSGSKVWTGVIPGCLCSLLGARYNYKGIFKENDGIKSPMPQADNLDDGVLTSISGRAGAYIDFLELNYDNSIKHAGGGGGSGGIPFSFDIPQDCFLLFINGHLDKVLQYFEIVYGKFHEAEWKALDDDAF
jgi:hypothetical protein